MKEHPNATAPAKEDTPAPVKKQASKGRLFSSFSKRGSKKSVDAEQEPVDDVFDSEDEEVEEETETPAPQPSPVATPPSPVAAPSSPVEDAPAKEPAPILEKTTSETPVTEDEEEEFEPEERAAVVKTAPSQTKESVDNTTVETTSGFWGLPVSCGALLCAQ